MPPTFVSSFKIEGFAVRYLTLSAFDRWKLFARERLLGAIEADDAGLRVGLVSLANLRRVALHSAAAVPWFAPVRPPQGAVLASGRSGEGSWRRVPTAT